MGQWTIVIQGTGIHHNPDPKDANEIAKRFVKELTDAGHQVTHAAFTSGSRDLVNADGTTGYD